MAIFKNEKFKKIGMLLTRLLVLGVLLFLLFQKEAVIVIKDLLDKFNINEETQMFMARTWGAIKILINSPSFVGLFIVFIQLLGVAFGFALAISFIYFPSTNIEEKLREKNYSVECFAECKKSSYLKNMRLLF